MTSAASSTCVFVYASFAPFRGYSSGLIRSLCNGLGSNCAPSVGELKHVYDIPQMGGAKINHRELQKIAQTDR